MHAYRTHTCGALRAADTGQTVRLSGWIHRKRDHGGLIFVDLRDRSGAVQLVIDPERSPEAHAVAHRLRLEEVIRVRGELVPRSEGTRNDQLPTGAVELAAERLLEGHQLIASDER